MVIGEACGQQVRFFDDDDTETDDTVGGFRIAHLYLVTAGRQIRESGTRLPGTAVDAVFITA
ncbi:hypothetical protein SDC9_46596 [bioreactor metagenome]|uniref:Uncharacterized protein n=1 Tax=bioreactor metagenome TaxID=1076179 RepID=A0A644W9F3_9ZZZZ